MPTALIGAAITGGASLVGGLLNKKKTATQVQQPLYTAGQTQLQDQTQQALSSRLANPTAQFDGLKTQALDQNNKNFAAAGDRLQTSLAARGFGSSGKFAGGVRSNEIARAGSAGGIESKFAGMEVEQRNQDLDRALKFSFAGPGQRTQSEQSGGGGVAGAVAGGAQTATFLYALNHLMGGGGLNLGGSGGEGPEYSGMPGGGTYQEGDDV